jgi:hypothetical protein
MTLKLKDNPREWRKFAVVAALVAVGLACLGWRRGRLPQPAFGMAVLLVLAALAAGLAWPRLVRPLYRGAMMVSYQVGQVVGRVLLALLFVVGITPLGLVLRLAGKDLLRLRRDRRATSYWQPARTAEHLDREF